MTLNELEIGKKGIVTLVEGEGALRQHLLDMGVIPGAEIEIVKFAPMGDPVEVRLYDYELTLRLDEAKRIQVDRRVCEDSPEDKWEAEVTQDNPKNQKEQRAGSGESKEEDGEELREHEHPGFGEEGRFHPQGTGNPLPEDEVLTFALVGNQNCGKTTLFNQLTGSNQRVGNFPGVTVDRKDGVIKNHPNTKITDLPGIYSMSPYSSEEIVSRNFVLQEHPKAIINIVDATNIERNLYLTLQLLEMNIPMVVALNMMDELHANGGTVDVNRMEKMLGVPVVPISAAKNQGIDELTRHVLHIARYQERPEQQDYCQESGSEGAVHRCIHSIGYFIEDHVKACDMPLRFTVSKLIEGDRMVEEALGLEANETDAIEHIISQMESECGLDRNAAMAKMRFAFIRRVCARCVKKPSESKERLRSMQIDRFLTGKWTGIPAFILVMAAIFVLTFNVIGLFLQELLEKGVGRLTGFLDHRLTVLETNRLLHSLIIDGIFNGVGSVLSFLPVIVTLFFFLSLLEDTGYAARVAFVMDRLLRKIGLSGRSIVPMLIGFGCTVPAVMATRTLPSERDRRMTILLAPFMSCTAKLPIYAFFVSAFFPGYGGLIITGLYFLGILMGILVALFYRNTLFKGEAVPFVMELPNYRLPRAKNILRLLWEKAKDFLERAFTVILVASVVVWFLQTFNFTLSAVRDTKDSMLAVIAGGFAVFMKPLGLGDYRICTALISGFMAKESVVSTLKVLYGTDVSTVMSASAAATVLVFSLLYTPCVAAIAAIRRELGRRWAVSVVIWQCMIAWLAAWVVHML